jgi:hypothetical protein
MVTLSALWLAILAASVIVFVASSIIHMAPLWHRNDFPPLARESEVISALRPLSIPPGDYFVPRPGGRDEMRSPEFKDKMVKGPVMVMTVMPNGMINMGRNLSQWFVFLLVVSLFTAYVTSRSLGVGTPYLRVFQFAGATAFIG